MRILFTGASGFLGKNILPVLSSHFQVKTIGLMPDEDYRVNFCDTIPDLPESFDLILHAAGKAHSIPQTEKEKQAFYDVNYQGTVNLCRALEKNKLPRTFVFISTVAVYGCETGENIEESHPLNGNTPYALSKKQAEEFLQTWCSQRGITLGILRPSLLAGINPPGNLGAMIKGIKEGKYLSIAGGKARKSILMAEDIARLIPLLIGKGGIYNLCDDEHPSFRQLEQNIAGQLGKKCPKNIPYWMAKTLALAGDCWGANAPINSLKLKKITKSLTFSNEKAKRELGWQPLNVLEQFKIN